MKFDPWKPRVWRVNAPKGEERTALWAIEGNGSRVVVCADIFRARSSDDIVYQAECVAGMQSLAEIQGKIFRGYIYKVTLWDRLWGVRTLDQKVNRVATRLLEKATREADRLNSEPLEDNSFMEQLFDGMTTAMGIKASKHNENKNSR